MENYFAADSVVGGDRSDEKLGSRTSQQYPSVDIEGTDYYMNHEQRGMAIIFNHFKFDSYKYKNLERGGTEKDCERLEKTFEALGFEVKVYNDQDRQQIDKRLQEVAGMDHRNSDCIVVIVLSHGTKGRLEARDGTYDVDDLLESILSSKSLIGKPKLFFIQACRGNARDEVIARIFRDSFSTSVDMLISTESSPQFFKIPSTADLLVMYATYEGSFALRNVYRGSRFIQALCDELDANGTKDDLLRLLTAVNRKAAFKIPSNEPESSKLNAIIPMPSIVSMLTKTLKFNVKETISENNNTSTD